MLILLSLPYGPLVRCLVLVGWLRLGRPSMGVLKRGKLGSCGCQVRILKASRDFRYGWRSKLFKEVLALFGRVVGTREGPEGGDKGGVSKATTYSLLRRAYGQRRCELHEAESWTLSYCGLNGRVQAHRLGGSSRRVWLLCARVQTMNGGNDSMSSTMRLHAISFKQKQHE